MEHHHLLRFQSIVLWTKDTRHSIIHSLPMLCPRSCQDYLANLLKINVNGAIQLLCSHVWKRKWKTRAAQTILITKILHMTLCSKGSKYGSIPQSSLRKRFSFVISAVKNSRPLIIRTGTERLVIHPGNSVAAVAHLDSLRAVMLHLMWYVPIGLSATSVQGVSRLRSSC